MFFLENLSFVIFIINFMRNLLVLNLESNIKQKNMTYHYRKICLSIITFLISHLIDFTTRLFSGFL